jgi:CPA2 family monovalent cation:H+ antiporter-2
METAGEPCAISNKEVTVNVLALGAPPLVADFAVLTIGAAVLGYICQRMGLESIVGFLVAGAIVGPNALEIVNDPELVDGMGEIGVIFLMFAIGLELSADRLKQMGLLMVGGGAIQVVSTVAIVTGLCALWDVDAKTGIYTGCLVALSSTAVVLKLLSSRQQTESEVGRISIAFLIFQDIAVVVMVLLVPILGGEGGGIGGITSALAKAAVVVLAMLIGSRYVIPPFLQAVHRHTDDEEFLFAVLAIGAGFAWLVTFFGMTASLGAFIGGLVVSSGPYRHKAEEFVTPFKMVFAAVFFASIGMLLDIGFVLDNLVLVAVLAGLAVLVKVVPIAGAARLLGQRPASAAAAAFLLAQIGEFSFVLQKVGAEAGLSVAGQGAEGDQAFIATTVVLIALTPGLYRLSIIIGRRVLRRTDPQLAARAFGPE